MTQVPLQPTCLLFHLAVVLQSKMLQDSHQMDYSKITANIYIGSDLCKGTTCEIHGAEFEDLGILAEINLSVEKKEHPPDGIDIYAWIPVADHHAPTQTQLDMGSALINETVKDGKNIYIHCKNGHGRSPTMVASYLIRYKGMRTAEAIEFISSKRKAVHLEDAQPDALDEFYERWKEK